MTLRELRTALNELVDDEQLDSTATVYNPNTRELTDILETVLLSEMPITHRQELEDQVDLDLPLIVLNS